MVWRYLINAYPCPRRWDCFFRGQVSLIGWNFTHSQTKPNQRRHVCVGFRGIGTLGFAVGPGHGLPLVLKIPPTSTCTSGFRKKEKKKVRVQYGTCSVELT